MPSGAEIHVGFTSDQFDLASHAMGISVLMGDSFADLELGPEAKSIIEKFRNAYLQTIKDVGFRVLGDDGGNYFEIETPAGLRKMSGFQLETVYDPIEIGHAPKEATLGVALSGRYYPTLLDYPSTHGTLLGLGIDLRMIEISRANLIKEFPVFTESKVLVVEKFY